MKRTTGTFILEERKRQFIRTLQPVTDRNRALAIEQAMRFPSMAPYWLVDLLQHEEGHVRSAAADAMKAIGNGDVVSSIRTKVRAGIPRSSRYTYAEDAFLHMVDILKVNSDPLAVPTLLELLECKNDSVSASAAEALAQIGDKNAAEPLVRTLLDREKKYRQWRIRRPLLFVAIIVCIVFLMLLTEGQGVGMLYVVLQGIIALWAYNQWSQFREKSVEALKILQDPKAIGALALVARDPRLRQQAVEALFPLLGQINGEDRFIALTPEQMDALVQMFSVQDEGFRLKLLQALAYIGDETALNAVENLAKNDEESAAVRMRAADILPEMRRRVERRAESRVLLRAASPEAEAATLMRAADPYPDLPNEQLMRPGE